MKIKPLIFLILLALPLVTIPIAVQAGTVNPKIWVSPGEIKRDAPCQVSQLITVEIKLWNKKEITGASIYAYDLKVKVDWSLLSFVKSEVIIPAEWLPDKYFIAKDNYNETKDPDPTKVYYQLLVTALDTAPPLDDVQIVLVRLTFHIEKEPCWAEDCYTTTIDVYDVELSSPCGEPITIEDDDITDGTVSINPSRPALWLDPEDWTAGCICKNQVITVMATNLTKVYGFEFKVEWNNSKLLEANIQCVHVTDLLAAPYADYEVRVGDNFVYVKVKRPCEKPTISCVEGPIVNICFHTCFDDLGKALPKAEDVKIEIKSAKIYIKCPDPDPGSVTPTVARSIYEWRPKVEDLNLDCHVDIVDLGAIAAQYGNVHVWTELASPTDQSVDIYDIVMVAKRFCKTN